MVLLRSAIYATTAVIERSYADAAPRARRRHRRLAGADDAPAPARRRRAARPAPARDPARRRAGHARAAGPRPRRRLARRPDLRAHAGLLAGHRGRARRPGDRRAGAARSARDARARRRDPRRGPDGGRRRRRCARATSAASTTAAAWSSIGRKADTIVTGGENVAPAEVEAVLLEHPAVAEAGVFARPHPEWGEAVTASVVLRARRGARGAAALLRRAPGRLQGPEGGRGDRDAPAHAVWEAAATGASMTDHRQESRARWGSAAQGWEAHGEQLRRPTMPVSAWMIDAIAPRPGDTLLELAAGPGDTGFLAAELIQPRRHADQLRPRSRDALDRPAARRRARPRQRALQADRRRALDRHRGREHRRRAVPLGLHADGRPRHRAARDAPGAQARRPARARRVGGAGGEPVERSAGARARAPRAARASRPDPSPGSSRGPRRA